jgi:integrase/recombinase XerD
MFLDYKPPTALKHIPDPLPEGIPGVHKLIDTATDWRLKTIVGLCGLAGLRISESLSLPPSNIDFQNNLLTVRGKGDKERTVPFGDQLSDILMEAVVRSMGQPVIVEMGDRLARRTITRLGKRARLRREIASHQLRATFATHLVAEGVDIRTVQELLGHANVTTTQGYTAVTLNRMRDAVKGL